MIVPFGPFFTHLLQKFFLLFLSTTLWGVDCERKNSAYVASGSLQRFHTCSACKIMFEMSIATSSLMFTWILLELTGEATKREGKRKRQDVPMQSKRREENPRPFGPNQLLLDFHWPWAQQPPGRDVNADAVSLAAPVSTFKGSWWQLGSGDR